MSDIDITNTAGRLATTSLNQVGNANDVAGRQAVSESGNALPPSSDKDVGRTEVVQAVSDITEYMQNTARGLQFEVEETTGGIVVTVLNTETDEIIRQIPTEEAITIARYIAEQAPDPLRGLLVSGES